jgi:hypothetical protein
VDVLPNKKNALQLEKRRTKLKYMKHTCLRKSRHFLSPVTLKNFVCGGQKKYTGYFTSDNEPEGIQNATHNTLERKPGRGGDKYPAFPPDVLWVAFSIPPGSLSLVKYPVCI